MIRLLQQPLRRLSSSLGTSECRLDMLEGANAGVAVISLNRPQARNALSAALVDSFQACLDLIRRSPASRVLILRSQSDNVFCAGADLKERALMAPSDVSRFLISLRRSFSELESLPIPTIASIDGPALGGGLELALCCDLRVAGPNAKLGLPETKLAIIPGAGGTQRLPRLIGIARAKELIFTARVLSNQQALEYGIVSYAVAASTGGGTSDTYEKCLSLAREMLPQGPIAMRMAKLAIDCGIQLDLASGLNFEQTCYAQVIPTRDRIEGLRAFAEKRPAIYVGE